MDDMVDIEQVDVRSSWLDLCFVYELCLHGGVI